MRRRLLLASALAAPLLAAPLLSGCGFALRGSGGGSLLPFQTVHISGASGPLVVELRRNIVAGGNTAVVDDPQVAQGIVHIISQTRDKQVLSLNSQGRVREYTLRSHLQFLVRDNKGLVLLEPTALTIRRTLSFNESQVLAKEAEEASLYREMQSDLVQQMMRRLAAIKLP